MPISKSRLFVATAIWSVTLISHKTAADMAPLDLMMFHSIEQEEQDVHILLTPYSLETTASQAPRKLSRISGSNTMTVAEFAMADISPISSGRVCGDYEWLSIDIPQLCERYPENCLECDDDDTTVCIGESCDTCTEYDKKIALVPLEFDNFCDQYPSYKVDCDNDGTAECCMVCQNNTFYEFWDFCVPPGEVTYELSITYGSDTRAENQTEFTVTDAETSCEPTEGDSKSTDNPSDSADNSGCSVTGIGRPSDFGTMLRLLLP